MVSMAVAGVLIAWLYYRTENAAEDPRVMEARRMLAMYDELIREGKQEEGFKLLDSIEATYRKVPCYAESYEMGVVYNNRGSAWLTMALYKTSDSIQKAEILALAEQGIKQSITSYQHWLNRFDPLSDEQLRKEVVACFPEHDPAFRGKRYSRIINRRIRDLNLAKIETKRRLSVSYSNLGIIQRHLYQQDSAIISYLTALKLWKRNPTAKNNLNTLLGRPVEDESILQQLFPPDRRKPD